MFLRICHSSMEDLIDIGNYSNTVLIKYGNYIDECSAIYMDKDDSIEFRIKFKYPFDGRSKYFQYIIANYNFIITDTEILVNKSSIDAINHYISDYTESMKIDQE